MQTSAPATRNQNGDPPGSLYGVACMAAQAMNGPYQGRGIVWCFDTQAFVGYCRLRPGLTETALQAEDIRIEVLTQGTRTLPAVGAMRVGANFQAFALRRLNSFHGWNDSTRAGRAVQRARHESCVDFFQCDRHIFEVRYAWNLPEGGHRHGIWVLH